MHYPISLDAGWSFPDVKDKMFLDSNLLAIAIHHRFLNAHRLPITITRNPITILCPPTIEVPLVTFNQSFAYKNTKSSY